MVSSNEHDLLQSLAEVTWQLKLLKSKQDELKAALAKSNAFSEAASGPRVFTLGSYVLKMAPMAGRNTLDKTAVEAAGIDLSPYYKKGKPSVRISAERVTN